MKNQVRAYFYEGKCFHEGHKPTIEEYMSMGEILTKEAFDWVISDPKIITTSTVIGRLMDDINSHKVL